jgi:hypothetical protein
MGKEISECGFVEKEIDLPGLRFELGFELGFGFGLGTRVRVSSFHKQPSFSFYQLLL